MLATNNFHIDTNGSITIHSLQQCNLPASKFPEAVQSWVEDRLVGHRKRRGWTDLFEIKDDHYPARHMEERVRNMRHDEQPPHIGAFRLVSPDIDFGGGGRGAHGIQVGQFLELTKKTLRWEERSSADEAQRLAMGELTTPPTPHLAGGDSDTGG